MRDATIFTVADSFISISSFVAYPRVAIAHSPICCSATNNRSDRILIFYCIFQELDIQHTAALGSSISIGGKIKRVTGGSGRQHTQFRDIELRVGANDEIDAANQGSGAVTR